DEIKKPARSSACLCASQCQGKPINPNLTVDWLIRDIEYFAFGIGRQHQVNNLLCCVSYVAVAAQHLRSGRVQIVPSRNMFEDRISERGMIRAPDICRTDDHPR